MTRDDETLPPDVGSGWRAALPPWMACYVLLGIVQSGMLPVILPLAAPPGPAAGLTYAAFAATGMAAPLVGAWSDRTRRHRFTLALGLGLAGCTLLLHALPGGLLQHVCSAAVVGLGVSSASTVATMFIVEVVPEAEWDRQIGALQACIGGGQLAGLLLAGALGLHHVGASFLLGAVLLLGAVPLALRLAPDPVVRVPRAELPARAPRGGDAVAMGPQRSLHPLTRRGLAALEHNGLAWFLGAWLLSYTATNGLSVMFAVAMVRIDHVAATLPTGAYALGVGVSLLLYRSVAGWDLRFGPWRVLATGLGLRVLLLGAMVLFAAMRPGTAVMPILLCFALMQVVWPLLSVASTRLAVTLSPARRAESVGLLNAATSLGATVGGVLGGVLLREGFAALCAAVLAALLLALMLAWHPGVRLDEAS